MIEQKQRADVDDEVSKHERTALPSGETNPRDAIETNTAKYPNVVETLGIRPDGDSWVTPYVGFTLHSS